MNLKAKIKQTFNKKYSPETAEEISNLWRSSLLPLATHLIIKDDFQSVLTKSPICADKKDKEIYNVLKKVILDRIKQKKDSENYDDLWQYYIVPKYADFLQSVIDNKDDKAIKILNHMFDNELVYGFESTNVIHGNLSKLEKKSIHLRYMSSLVDLCEYLQLIPVENIEQNQLGKYILQNPDDLLDLIEAKLGIKIKFPTFKNNQLAIQTKRGSFTFRDISYLYIAIKIKEFFPDKTNIKVCEIGGGMGYLAYYLDIFGIKDVTIVDIPTTSNVSAWFLMKSLPEREFLFETDEEIFSDNKKIKLVMPETFLSAPDDYFDIVINCDSLPEINANIATNYLKTIQRVAKQFYSINQEAEMNMWSLNQKQNVIHKLINNIELNNKKSFVRLTRNLFWLRRGYVEELYIIK